VEQRSAFHGLSLVNRRWATTRSSGGRRRLLQVNARTAAKNIEVEVDKPLGLTLGQKPGGGVVITVSATATTLSSILLFCFLPISTHAFCRSLSLNGPRTLASSNTEYG
jgi:hypothetical protein